MWDCYNQGGNWQNAHMNFDNIIEAISSLFVISNTVQWSDIMYSTSKSRGINLMPSPVIQSQLSTLFFVFAVIIGNFFLMNLFIGVIITSYNRSRELLGGHDSMLTEK